MPEEPTLDITERLHSPDAVIAVVGATDQPGKYGGEIYRDLREKGYTVRAVNPGRTTVAGDPCWPSLRDLPERPAIVNIVVPPERTLSVLEECLHLGLDGVWIQPGAADDAVRQFVSENGFDALIDACIMVRTRARR